MAKEITNIRDKYFLYKKREKEQLQQNRKSNIQNVLPLESTESIDCC